MASPDGLTSPAAGAPLRVLLNVYDVAQGDGKGTVVRLNNLVGPRGLGLGGVFHGAIVLGTVEFSFGFCEQGTGLYAVKAGQNPMYTFRETIDLGPTSKSMAEIRSIVQDMKQQWPGASYDLLYRNCCHFCVDLAARLEVGPVPGWLNRFASGAAATINITQDTVKTVQEFGAEVGRLWNKTLAAATQQQQSIAEKLQQQQQQWRSSSQPQPHQHHQQQQQREQRASFTGFRNGGLLPTPRTPRSSAPLTPRGNQLVDSAAQAGQQLWSNLTQAGNQLKATTTRLAQAAAGKAGSTRPSSSGYSTSSNSDSGGQALLEGSHWQEQQQQGQQPLLPQQQQEQRVESKQGSFASKEAPAAAVAGGGGRAAGAAAAVAAGGVAAAGVSQGATGDIERTATSAPTHLPLGAQPKLLKEYRLSSAGGSFLAFPNIAAVAAPGSGVGPNGGALGLQSCESDDPLMPFLSVDDVDPFVALVGEDDAEDDAQQKAAVESVLQHSPAPTAAAPAVHSQ